MQTDARRSAWLDDVLETWIGWTRPPYRLAWTDAGWTPERRGDACLRCGSSVGPGEARRAGCGGCRGRPAVADGVLRLGPHEGALRDWVLDLKFRRWTAMGTGLGFALGAVVAARLREAGVDPETVVVVPTPMPWRRRLVRGVDHADVLADGVSRHLGVRRLRALRRASGPPQAALSRQDRLRGGAVAAVGRRASAAVRGRVVILVDDVLTTGATVRRSALALRHAGARRVIAAVVSVSDDRARQARRTRLERICPDYPSKGVDTL